MFNRKSNAHFYIDISHDSSLSAAYICLRTQKAKINLMKNLNMFSQHPAWVISPVTQWKYGLLHILLLFPTKKNGSCTELRLNSPLVKFKITNMADDQVNFTPEDIFSASFCEKET